MHAGKICKANTCPVPEIRSERLTQSLAARSSELTFEPTGTHCPDPGTC